MARDGRYLIDGMQVRVDAGLCTSLPGMKGNPEGDRPAGKGGGGRAGWFPPKSGLLEQEGDNGSF